MHTQLDSPSFFFCLPPKIGLRARILNRLLKNILHLVPVSCVNPLNVSVKVPLDLVEYLPFRSVRYKRDGDTNATETSRTTDTMEISLVVCFAWFTGNMQFGNILFKTKLVSC